MKMYNTPEEIEADLHRFKLERDIAWEELKLVKHQFKEDLQPFHWVQTGVKYASKFGFMLLLKKLFR